MRERRATGRGVGGIKEGRDGEKESAVMRERYEK